jgi:hypothetical protein
MPLSSGCVNGRIPEPQGFGDTSENIQRGLEGHAIGFPLYGRLIERISLAPIHHI